MNPIDKLREKKREIDALLERAESLTGGPGGLTRREQKRRQARERSRFERDIQIPAVENPGRRANCEADIFLWLQTYLPRKFSQPFTEVRRQIVLEILRCAKTGEDQAIAAPRGEGKSSLAEGTLAYCIATGLLKFIVIVGANAKRAEEIQKNIKVEFEDNTVLAADYPEICTPVRELEGAHQRGGTQTVHGGQRTRIQWAGDTTVFPTIPGSKASGTVLMAYGLDSAIRGVRFRDQRPDFVLLDDLDTRESAESDSETAKRERIIEQDVGGLSAPGRRLGRVILCTVLNRRCLAYRYTDRTQKPSWNGNRFQFMPTKPHREDLWDDYILKRQTAGKEVATDYYTQNRDAMDAGAETTNPYRLEPGQLSSIQFYYDELADKGAAYVACELQNDPPEEEGPEESGISAPLIQCRVNMLPRYMVPGSATVLTAGIDLGKYNCHWVVTAWQHDATGYIIDYGVLELHGTEGQDDAGIEDSLRRALHRWREETLAEPYRTASTSGGDGNERKLDIILIDTGWREEGPFGFIRDVGGKPYRGAKGFGSSPNQSPFRAGRESNPGLVLGEQWYAQRRPDGTWMHGLNADYWKRWLHDRLLTPVGGRGSLSLFGSMEDAKQHTSIAKHLTAEIEREEFTRGKGLKRVWFKLNRNNHWLDACYMACAAAAMAGVKLAPATTQLKTEPTKPATTVQPMAPHRSGFIHSWRGRF